MICGLTDMGHPVPPKTSKQHAKICNDFILLYILTSKSKTIAGSVGVNAHCMPYNFLPVVVILIQIENHDDTNANLNKLSKPYTRKSTRDD